VPTRRPPDLADPRAVVPPSIQRSRRRWVGGGGSLAFPPWRSGGRIGAGRRSLFR